MEVDFTILSSFVHVCEMGREQGTTFKRMTAIEDMT